MLLAPLDRKLLRDVTRLWGQVVTIALVLASGIACFVSLRGTYESLDWSRQAYYERSRFADLWARLERAPESVAARLAALPGVAALETRVAEEVTLPLPGMARPAYGQMLSVPVERGARVNALVLRAGRLPRRGADDEVVLLESFARTHGITPGDRVPVILNRQLRRLRVVGLAQSPEFVYAIRPGALVDDPARYAVLFMERSALAAAFQLSGAFDEVALALQPGARAAAVRADVDRVLAPYGGDGSIERAQQVSNRILTGELGQLAALAGMVPLVFLGVAMFLIHMVLSRLIALQRPEIAALKALGYRNGELRRHYLGLVLVVLVPASLVGTLGGWGLGEVVFGMYARIFRFPDASFRMTFALVGSGILVSALAAVAGALLAVRAATRLPPAEAMRPPAPARYRRSLIERLGLGVLAGPNGMMVLREIQRRPLRTLLSSLGVAGAVALLILGRFGLDSLDHYLESTLRREQRQDLQVAFVAPLSPRAISDLARLPGVRHAEGLRLVPVRARHDHVQRDSALVALPPGAELRRLVEQGGREVGVPEGGVLVTRTLGEILGVHVGDQLDLELREGDRRSVRPTVAGFVDEAVGLFVYASAPFVAGLERDAGAVSSVLLTIDPPALPAIEAELRRSPAVIDVAALGEDIQRLRDMNGSIMDIWTAVSITLAACVIFGVVYNNARIALAMRSRDLASLRVLGVSRSEISWILIGGLAIEVALAIPLGLWLGYLWARLFMGQVDQETFRFQVVVAPRTYFLAATVAVLAATASALWVRRSLDRLDLIGVLKTRE